MAFITHNLQAEASSQPSLKFKIYNDTLGAHQSECKPAKTTFVKHTARYMYIYFKIIYVHFINRIKYQSDSVFSHKNKCKYKFQYFLPRGPAHALLDTKRGDHWFRLCIKTIPFECTMWGLTNRDKNVLFISMLLLHTIHLDLEIWYKPNCSKRN